MSAGQQPTLELAKSQLTSAALRLHLLMNEITDLHLQYSVKLDVAGLEGLGMSAQEAADDKARWDTLGTIAAVYFGTAAQDHYNTDDALADTRGGIAS